MLSNAKTRCPININSDLILSFYIDNVFTKNESIINVLNKDFDNKKICLNVINRKNYLSGSANNSSIHIHDGLVNIVLNNIKVEHIEYITDDNEIFVRLKIPDINNEDFYTGLLNTNAIIMPCYTKEKEPKISEDVLLSLYSPTLNYYIPLRQVELKPKCKNYNLTFDINRGHYNILSKYIKDGTLKVSTGIYTNVRFPIVNGIKDSGELKLNAIIFKDDDKNVMSRRLLMPDMVRLICETNNEALYKNITQNDSYIIPVGQYDEIRIRVHNLH